MESSLTKKQAIQILDKYSQSIIFSDEDRIRVSEGVSFEVTPDVVAAILFLCGLFEAALLTEPRELKS